MIDGKFAVGKTNTFLFKTMAQEIRSVLCLFWFVAAFSRMLGAADVDVVFMNGNIYTVNEKQPKAEAMAVKNGRFVFVGSNEGRVFALPLPAPGSAGGTGRTSRPRSRRPRAPLWSARERRARSRFQSRR